MNNKEKIIMGMNQAIEWYTTKEGTYFVRNYNPRKNKQIWRIAKYIHDTCTVTGDSEFEGFQPWYKDRIYDAASKLLNKIINNEFTGDDDHAD